MSNLDINSAEDLRFDWERDDILAILNMPLIDLMWKAQIIHRKFNNYKVQLASLFSVKTGGCTEDCSYCSQSIYSSSQLKSDPLQEVESVLKRAQIAKEEGAERFCMGWAWREIRDGGAFNSMLEMVKGVRKLGMEACVTAGMLNENQALKLAEAGLTAYNHNLDTSPEYYKNIITTRTYQDRLDTLKRVRDAGINICCGGIIGLGETNNDRASLLKVLSNMNPHPESVPINSLVAIEGTGLEESKEIDSIEMIRMIATARIIMPKSKIRLSAGREKLSKEAQILCFQCGANSIFYGDELLTTSNPACETDRKLLKEVGVSFNKDFVSKKSIVTAK
ncbi:MAG: biotin synthase BioB [Prochlorococcus sp. SP3034]|nr:biotin synthase BioB [Prochlorococcus sp. SP3034]|tara:strand:+ start:14735 stop:15742 length:1008 start_codon:yes stop_codon:yes gene_type:complete